jgi:FkbM family methyltransferase
MSGLRGQVDPSLIIDVGMNDGSDTAYYLRCGYRVVAVEANPALVSAAERRFQPEIADGRLTLLNVGIAEDEGESDFWIAEANDQWSSFSKPIATRRGATVLAQPVRVRCSPLSKVLADVGTPYYLKIDIEGYDAVGVESLAKEITPQYISVEFAHGMETRLLQRLLDLGYDRFKLLNQVTFTDKPPIFEHEKGLRALRKLYRKLPAARPLVRKIVPRSDFDTFHRTHGWSFPEGSSGPFGEQTYGPWMTSGEIHTRYTELRRSFEKAGAVFWWDLHAKAPQESLPVSTRWGRTASTAEPVTTRKLA